MSDIVATEWGRAEERIAKLRDALARQDNEICQILGAALGYPRYVDDLEIFPDATPEDGVCVGEQVAATIAAEAAAYITRLEERLRGLEFVSGEAAKAQADERARWNRALDALRNLRAWLDDDSRDHLDDAESVAARRRALELATEASRILTCQDEEERRESGDCTEDQVAALMAERDALRDCLAAYGRYGMKYYTRCECGEEYEWPEIATHNCRNRRARLAQVIDRRAVLRRRLAYWFLLLLAICAVATMMGRC